MCVVIVIGNCAPITFKNPLKPGFAIRNILLQFVLACLDCYKTGFKWIIKLSINFDRVNRIKENASLQGVFLILVLMIWL